MALFRWWLCLLCVAVLLAVAKGMADAPRAKTADSKASPPAREEPGKAPTAPPTGLAIASDEKKSAPPAALSLDMLKLPAGAILVLCEEAKEAVRLIPKMVVLTPQEYQKLLEQIEQLKRRLETDKTDNPSICRLTGHVADDLVYLRAQFEFRTDRPKSFINLGCLGAWPTAASLDDSLPWLQARNEGIILQADTPGAHRAILDLVLPPKRDSKGEDRSFELDLPRAAITTLEQFDLPAAVVEVRVGNRTVRTRQVEPQRSRLERVPVVPQHHLSLTWKGAAQAPKGPPVLRADGHIIVRVSTTHVFTEAEFHLRVLRGETDQWRMRVPLPADATLEVKPQPQDEQRIGSIDLPGDKQDPMVTIRLKESTADPLRVTLHIRQPRSAGALAVGPFTVLDALTQQGDIEVHAQDDLRLRYQAAGEVSQREVGEDQRGQNARAVFTYWNMPGSTQPAQPAPPLLALQVEAVKGAVETYVTQSLALEGDSEGMPHWQVTTKVDVTPIRTAVDRLEVFFPADYKFDKDVGPTPAEIVEDVLPDPQKPLAQIKLAHKQLLPFSVTLVGSYPVPAGQQETSLELVRPLTWGVERGVSDDRQLTSVLDRGCQVNVVMPQGVEFVARQFRGNLEGKVREALQSFFLPLRPKAGSHEYTWQGERTPPRIDLAWHFHRPELPVDALADVTLAGHQARVRHRLHYQFGQTSPARLLLRMPAELHERVKILAGGTIDAEHKTPGELAVNVAAVAGKEHDLTLEYSFDLPAPVPGPINNQPSNINNSFRRFTVPLVKPEQATRGETKVRVWCDPGEQPGLAGGSWTELPTEIVPEQDHLPALVLRGGLDSALLLHLTEHAVTPLATAVIERVLAQAAVVEGGLQDYHVRFLLSKLSARHLELILPVLLPRADLLEVSLDGKRVPLNFVDETGKEVDIGKVVRLRVVPELYRKPVILAVRYQADSGRMEGNGPWQVTLRPPVLQGGVLLGRARWQVELPGGWLPLSPRGDSTVEQRWGWLGWQPAPRAALSNAELEQWFSGSEAPVDDGAPSLVCWQTALGPLALIQVPQRAWLLVCSLTLLALGLGLLLAPLPRFLFWSCVAVIGGTVAAIGVLSPAALPVLGYGCEPGAVVLVLAVGAQWMLHQHYRRQVIFMPGFTRLKTGSSLIRGGSSNRPRDPSTVDEPPKRPSSIVPGAQRGNSGQ